MFVNEMMLFSVSITETFKKSSSTWCVNVVANNSRDARKKAVSALELQGLVVRKYISHSDVFIENSEVFA